MPLCIFVVFNHELSAYCEWTEWDWEEREGEREGEGEGETEREREGGEGRHQQNHSLNWQNHSLKRVSIHSLFHF